MSLKNYHLFEVVGVEIEYMVVHQQSFGINPIVDALLQELAGKITNEVAFDKVAISNELVSHVIELKMNGPQHLSAETHVDFHDLLNQRVLPLVKNHNSLLLPTSMHPNLKTDSPDIKIWPHGNKDIYNKYDEIFGCHGHGFSNIQSVHLNLPFANNEEFVLLHQAIRFVLPLIPALCASSPYVEGAKGQGLDSRLLFYKNNQHKIPIIAGDVIPEEVRSIDDYYQKILMPIDEALKPYNQDEVLESEWVNSRGAIARFERNAIEIRLMDSQECPLADMACVAAITAILKDLIFHQSISLPAKITNGQLKNLMMQAIYQGFDASVEDKQFLSLLSLNQNASMTFKHVLDKLIERASHLIEPVYLRVLEDILRFGNLAERMISSIKSVPFNQTNSLVMMKQLASCLEENKLFMQ